MPAVRLVRGKGKVLEPFFSRVYVQTSIRELIWVSPWITHFSFNVGNTDRLLKKINEQQSRLTIVTRPPEPSSEHEQFLADINEISSCEVYFLPFLHAKFYLCTARNHAFAMIGSPNLYRWTRDSYEIGVVIESRGDGEIILADLEALTIELRTHRSITRSKKREV